MFKCMRGELQWKIGILMFILPLMSNSANRYGLNGAFFRVSAHNFPPYANLIQAANGSLLHLGSTPNMIAWIAKKCNFTYQYVPVDYAEIFKFGSVQAGLNQIINKDVHISTLGIVPTIDRSQLMEFSYPLAIESFKILVPKPEEESRLFAFVRPFQLSVWLYMLLTFFIVLLLSTGFTWYYYHKETQKNKKKLSKIIDIFSYYATYMLSIYINQGFSITAQRNSIRILVGFWLLAATVLINSYSGVLVSSLTMIKLQQTVNSLEDLAASRDITMTTSINSNMAKTMLNTSHHTLKAIGDGMRRKPESLFLNPENGFANLLTMKYALPTTESYASFLVNIDLNKTGKCRFQLTDRVRLSEMFTFGLQKSETLLNQLFSEKLLFLWETGLIDKWRKKDTESSKTKKCLAKNKESPRQKPIKLVDFTSVFLILGVGGSLAILCFMLEMIYFRYKLRQQGRGRPISV